ncbi:DoxX family protein [Sphaerisporangium sp. NPDC004334]
MPTIHVIVTVVTIIGNAAMAVADFSRSPFVLANSAEVGVPPRSLPLLGALKAAGAAGLLIGLLGVPVIGLAAATGLVLFFLGAVATHVRTRVFHNLAFPAGYLLLAVATLTLTLATST